MQTALAILSHALRMLIFDMRKTLTVLLPAFALVIGCALLTVAFAPDMLAYLASGQSEALLPPSDGSIASPPSGFFWIVGLGIIGLLGYALMAVLWHRHVLLNGAEDPSALFPTFGVMRMYIVRAIVVVLVQLAAGVPILFIVGILSALLITSVGPGAIVLMSLLGGLAFVWVALRVSLVLPSAAVGVPMSIKESWRSTDKINGAIIGVSALLAGLNVLTVSLAALIAPDPGGMSFLISTVIYVFEGLIFVSVLTTLYGTQVEGRSLS